MFLKVTKKYLRKETSLKTLFPNYQKRERNANFYYLGFKERSDAEDCRI